MRKKARKARSSLLAVSENLLIEKRPSGIYPGRSFFNYVCVLSEIFAILYQSAPSRSSTT